MRCPGRLACQSRVDFSWIEPIIDQRRAELLLRATDTFLRAVVGATLGSLVLYAGVLVLRAFHVDIKCATSTGWTTIGIKLVIAGVAATNWVPDLDQIDAALAARYTSIPSLSGAYARRGSCELYRDLNHTKRQSFRLKIAACT